MLFKSLFDKCRIKGIFHRQRLRWILALPVAYIVELIVISAGCFGVICVCACLGLLGVMSSETLDVCLKIFLALLVGIIGAPVFVVAGTITAPKRRFMVAVVLTAISVGVHTMWLVKIAKIPPSPTRPAVHWSFASYIAGVFLMILCCFYFWRKTRKNNSISHKIPNKCGAVSSAATSEEERIEVQKPKISRLALLCIFCGTFCVLFPFAGMILLFIELVLFDLMGKQNDPLSRRIGTVIAFAFVLIIPLLLGMASVISGCASLTVIKRSKGKLCGKWLVYLSLALLLAFIALIAIYIRIARRIY